jgi:hypothetical protein
MPVAVVDDVCSMSGIGVVDGEDIGQGFLEVADELIRSRRGRSGRARHGEIVRQQITTTSPSPCDR